MNMVTIQTGGERLEILEDLELDLVAPRDEKEAASELAPYISELLALGIN